MWTISGWSAGRPLTAKIRRTASALDASAASPYTVSVGMATRPPARNTDERSIDVAHGGTASRNSSAASMNPNASGVAKWSTLRKRAQRRVGQRIDQRLAGSGEVAIADHHQCRAGHGGQHLGSQWGRGRASSPR